MFNWSLSPSGCGVSTGYKGKQLIDINDLSHEKIELFILQNGKNNHGEVLFLLKSQKVCS